MSDFKLYELQSINVINDRIVFSGNAHIHDTSVLPENQLFAPNRSEIYAVKFDRTGKRVLKPDETLSPLFLIGGLSVEASLSTDGRRAAITNTETGHGRYRYDLVMMKGDESGHRIILQGLGFSSAAFLGETVLFNEMFENRYDLRLFDFADHSLQTIASIDCTPKKLLSLERVHLVIDDERSG